MVEYIVLDMEWNQAKNKRHKITSPIKLDGEIIQIGAVKMNEALEVIDTFSVNVKPVFYTKMNKEVERVTLLTDKDIENGVPFKKAIRDFENWCNGNKKAVMLTWGPCDIIMLEDNLEIHGLDKTWIPENFDAQWLFDDQVTMEGKRYSLDYARYKFNIKGRNSHNALNDASNTAEVLQHLNVAEWIEEERAYEQSCSGIFN